MRQSTRWIVMGAAALLLGGTARAGTPTGDEEGASRDPAAEPAPAAGVTEGADASNPANAPAAPGEDVRTAQPGSGFGEPTASNMSRPEKSDRMDAAALAAGNTGGRG